MYELKEDFEVNCALALGPTPLSTPLIQIYLNPTIHRLPVLTDLFASSKHSSVPTSLCSYASYRRMGCIPRCPRNNPHMVKKKTT